MGGTMPSKAPAPTATVSTRLLALGQQIRQHRKGLHVSATTAAQAAGMSRVTLHRIENGEASVTIGAYMNAAVALGLDLGLQPDARAVTGPPPDRKGWIPARIRLSDYPQLKRLAWQVTGTDQLTPAEALGIYERNARHLDLETLDPSEQGLIDSLRLALGQGAPSV